jgi:putative ABC transport system substrate-binding protein
MLLRFLLLSLLFLPQASFSQESESARPDAVVGQVQQPTKIPRVGFLYPGSKQLSPMFDIVRRALADLGYVEGRNMIIEARFANGQYERCSDLAAELVSLKADVIAVQGAVTVREIKKVVTNTPTVFAIVVDPLAEDVVANVKHPGGNLTGVTTFDPQQARKQLELVNMLWALRPNGSG